MNFSTWLPTFDFQTILFSVTVLLLLKWLLNRHTDLPPGPWGIPVFGYLPFLIGKSPEKAFAELGKKYGNVMSLYLGRVLVIVLNDYAAMKEAYVKQGFTFSGKPLAAHNVFNAGDDVKGFHKCEGEEASELRRFTLSSFRDFGMGKTSLEPQIMDEIRHFLHEVGKSKGKPINLTKQLKTSIANVVATLEFGHRYEYDDEELQSIFTLRMQNNDPFGAVSPILFLPWLKSLPFSTKLFGLDKVAKLFESFIKFFRKKINQHKNLYVENSTMDYIDAYLTKKKAMERKSGSAGYFNDANLLGTVINLFGAGVETTSTTLLWSLLYLMKHPEVMQKVQNEIDEVIGLDIDPSIAHKQNMPYTEATMMEVLRISSIVPLSLVHSNLEETTLFGYRIPKRSYVIGNIWAVNQTNYKDPQEFNPERFLNANGKVQKPEHFMAFSIGKRNCIGESLAQMQLFLYFTSFLQKFNIQLPKGEKVSLDYSSGVSLVPKPFTICALER